MRLGHIAIVTADLERMKGRSSVWLMEPVGDSGPLARFLSSHGPGFHHLGLKTDDIAGEVRWLNGEIRALLSPRDCDGVLIEIVQRRGAK